MFKPWLKYILYRFNLAAQAGRLHFYYSRYRNRKANVAYRKRSPNAILPPDDHLHDTFALDYKKYVEDGSLAAREIIDWTKMHLPANPVILDWGCGSGRIIQHFPALLPGAMLYGCDINEERIEWNKEHYPGIAFTPVHGFTPMPYAPDIFDFVFGISVITHIEALLQDEWISELHRVIRPNGILLVSTQGKFYADKLLPHERKLLTVQGVFTRTYPKQGHRMMSTYHDAAAFRKMAAKYFTIISFYDGALHPEKLGGQDLWILAKS